MDLMSACLGAAFLPAIEPEVPDAGDPATAAAFTQLLAGLLATPAAVPAAAPLDGAATPVAAPPALVPVPAIGLPASGEEPAAVAGPLPSAPAGAGAGPSASPMPQAELSFAGASTATGAATVLAPEVERPGAAPTRAPSARAEPAPAPSTTVVPATAHAPVSAGAASTTATAAATATGSTSDSGGEPGPDPVGASARWAAPVPAVPHADAALAPAGAPAGAGAPSEVPGARMLERALAVQVVERVGTLRHEDDGDYELTVELEPADLGRVELRVRLTGGVVHVQVGAHADGTLDLVRRALPELRDALVDAGLTAGSLEVDSNAGRRPGERGSTGDARAHHPAPAVTPTRREQPAAHRAPIRPGAGRGVDVLL